MVESARLWTQTVEKLAAAPNVEKLIAAWSQSRAEGARTARHGLWTFALYSAAALGLIYALTHLLADQRDVLLPVISSIVGLIAGTGGVLLGRAMRG